MPLLSRLQAFSFNTESWFSTSSFIFVKNLLLLINFLSMLAGLILIGAGGYINTNSAEDIVGLSGSIAVASIVIGCIVTIISFLGCFGAANEKGVLLKTYFALLIILVILEISVGAAAYAKRDEMNTSIDIAWHNAAQGPNNSTIVGIEKLVWINELACSATILDDFKYNFDCCGFYNTTDAVVTPDCVLKTPNSTGCHDQLTATLKGSLSTIGAAGLALGLVELIGLIFSVVLFRKIASKETAQSNLLNEAWRINRTKVQYGYQNYQYV
ncbi:hypothetical protein BATDEDRAFT_24689 [Batrachochytrium dendrobatidis JAM81]|uniref:Tetraspanin n=1 Tax=Batrachochytrium dendrobatidis (strain JAM81 / FGSC 10211) TaxID=684364 RepID=F4P243_BATDJ|nr:uncharacterized protein BATDEDRAFT_24689 [Batrachochytrium dendrobatidis JAM81]EGF80794.1 hypothetical protein BATDEDRAFT_24689 [Batrachochytrium dendrobatidis JAM81]|eukprot:XP_006678515.1 hypothetical protein BATDEDRAFT_24689 [Batrachochytrium dendrobatidis JAM81]